MILSVVFLYLVKNILPMKYWLIVAALLGVLGFYVFRKLLSLAVSIANSKRRRLRVHFTVQNYLLVRLTT